MKQIVLRKLRKNTLTALSILLTLYFILSEGLMLSALLEDWSTPSERYFDAAIMLLCALLLGGAILWIIRNFRKCICITENSVIWMSGNTVIHAIPKEQITAYGVFCQYEKYTPGFPFFCYATVGKISAVANKYWHWRKRIYRKNQLEELEKAEEGMWGLPMRIYIY